MDSTRMTAGSSGTMYNVGLWWTVELQIAAEVKYGLVNVLMRLAGATVQDGLWSDPLAVEL